MKIKPAEKSAGFLYHCESVGVSQISGLSSLTRTTRKDSRYAGFLWQHGQ